MLRLSLCSCVVTLCSINYMSQFYLQLGTLLPRVFLSVVSSVFRRFIYNYEHCCLNNNRLVYFSLFSTVFERYSPQVYFCARLSSPCLTHISLRYSYTSALCPHLNVSENIFPSIIIIVIITNITIII